MTKKDIIDKVLEFKELGFNEFCIECGILPNTLRASLARDVISDENITKIHDKFGIRKQYLKTGKGEISEQSNLPVKKHEKLSDYTIEEFDLANPESNYRLIPRAVLETYNLIPERVIDFLLKSVENERNMNNKHELAIEGLLNKASRLQTRIDELEAEKAELLANITAQKK